MRCSLKSQKITIDPLTGFKVV